MKLNIEKKLSHKIWRKLVKKHQRKRHRTEKAILDECFKNDDLALLRDNSTYQDQQEEADELEREAELIEATLLKEQKEAWMKKDSNDHFIFLRKKEQGKLKLIKNQPSQNLKTSKKKNVETNEKLLEKSETHNPEPPKNLNDRGRRPESCPFFNKTGACRFGALCSREHIYPDTSLTILLPNMYTSFCLHEELIDEYDSDLTLEYSESETIQHFRDFYFDVLEEFRKFGNVIQLKVCCNKRPHLKGNVYVQFQAEESARKAVSKLNGRWYAGKQISCQLCPIEQWKSAICGLFWSNRCPKADQCNFLHVYRNPGNAFYDVDRKSKIRYLDDTRKKKFVTSRNGDDYLERDKMKYRYLYTREEHSPFHRTENKRKPAHSDTKNSIKFRRKSKSPKSRRKSKSPSRRKSRSSSTKRTSKSPSRRKSTSSSRRKSKSPSRRKSKSPSRRKSKSPSGRKSRSPNRNKI